MLNVLLADDETRTLHHLMTGVPWFQLGMEVCCTASNGSEALAFIESHPIDILITDIRMPGCDGIDLIRQAKYARGTGAPPHVQTRCWILSRKATLKKLRGHFLIWGSKATVFTSPAPLAFTILNRR